MEYFVGDHAFAWTGLAQDPIEVSPGGYGEPVQYLIDISRMIEFGLPRPVAYHVDTFMLIVDQWMNWKNGQRHPAPACRATGLARRLVMFERLAEPTAYRSRRFVERLGR